MTCRINIRDWFCEIIVMHLCVTTLLVEQSVVRRTEKRMMLGSNSKSREVIIHLKVIDSRETPTKVQCVPLIDTDTHTHRHIHRHTRTYTHPHPYKHTHTSIYKWSRDCLLLWGVCA